MEKLKPILRFPGFLSEWKKRRFGDLYTFKSTNSFSRDKLNYDDGEVYNIHYGDIHVKFRSNFKLPLETVPFINADLNLSNIGIDNYCQEGDLVIADASENYDDIGKSIEIIDLNNKRVVAGLHTFLARPITDQLMKGYGGYLMQTTSVKDQIKIIAQGTKVLGISTKRVADLKLILPETSEQTKIAEFLTAIDKRIELLTAKKEKLTLYKKGVMQKIFNQEIRFKPDEGGEFPEWEETTLGKIGSVVKLKNKENQITQVFTNSAKYGVVQQGDFFEREITTEVNLKNYYVIDSGQFVYNPRISNLAPVGPIGMNKMGKGLLSPLYTVFSISNGHLAFFEQYFKSTLWHQYMRDNGNSGARSDRMSVTVGVLMNLPLYIPTLMEQTKIAMFLTSLDTEIQKVEQQITLNHTYKKGLLQQLFV